MSRPIIAIIDRAAMRANLATARAHAPGARAWAVVKANAYGHGLANGVAAFAAADGLAVVEPEALGQLRALGWEKSLLLLEGAFDPQDWRSAQECNAELVVHCHEQIDMLEQAGVSGPLDVHLKINTGMNRLGFMPDAVGAAHARLSALGAVRAIHFVTHFANADDPGHALLPAAEQMRRFRYAIAGLDGGGSVANSAATLSGPALDGGWIRPGIMLYGGSPGPGSAAAHGLYPAMSLESRLIAIQQVPAGEAVGYGSRFVAGPATRIGIVACGYADGYPRHAPNGTPVLVEGVRVPLAGRVSMDMLAVDLSALPQARVGSQVTLWGRGLPVDEVAAAAGTIGYELMCALAPRVRVEVRDGAAPLAPGQ